MKRREFITLLGGSVAPRENAFAAVLWPRRARGEVSGCYTKFTSIAA
jgi:hypothetical protein